MLQKFDATQNMISIGIQRLFQTRLTVSNEPAEKMYSLTKRGILTGFNVIRAYINNLRIMNLQIFDSYYILYTSGKLREQTETKFQDDFIHILRNLSRYCAKKFSTFENSADHPKTQSPSALFMTTIYKRANLEIQFFCIVFTLIWQFHKVDH